MKATLPGFVLVATALLSPAPASGQGWRCDLSAYACRKVADIPVDFVQIP